MADFDPNVLKEFLVSLGFAVDEAGLSKFNKTVAEATSIVFKLGEAAVGAAAAVVGFVGAMAEPMDDLYWASQRLHTAVGNIKAFQFGIEQMGGSAKGARASLEGLASFLRTYPGAEAFLQRLGVPTRDAQGNPLQENVVMQRLAEQFKKMPYYRAKVYSNFLGIDEMTLMAMLRPGGNQYQQRLTGMYKQLGFDPQAAALKFHNFMIELRYLGQEFETAGEILALRFMPVAEKLVRWVEGAIKWFVALDKQTKGTSTMIAVGLVGALILLRKNLALLFSPAGLAFGTIGALLAALWELKNDFDNFKQGAGSGIVDWEKIAPQLQDLQTNLKDIAAEAGNAWKAISPFFGEQGQSPQTAALDLLNNSLRDLVDTLRVITDLLSGKFSKAVKDLGTSTLPMLAKTWADVMTGNWAMIPFDLKMMQMARQATQTMMDQAPPSKSQPMGGGPGQTGLLGLVRYTENSRGAAAAYNRRHPGAGMTEDTIVSPAGAIGRFQIMPATARAYGFDPKRLVDPQYSAKVARAILSDLSKKFHGNTDEILAAYNAGPGVVMDWLHGTNRSGKNPHLIHLNDANFAQSIPFSETRAYVARSHTWSGANAALAAAGQHLLKGAQVLSEAAGKLSKALGGTALTSNRLDMLPAILRPQGASHRNISMSTNTTVHVASNASPKMIANEASRANGDLLRNFAGAIR